MPRVQLGRPKPRRPPHSSALPKCHQGAQWGPPWLSAMLTYPGGECPLRTPLCRAHGRGGAGWPAGHSHHCPADEGTVFTHPTKGGQRKGRVFGHEKKAEAHILWTHRKSDIRRNENQAIYRRVSARFFFFLSFMSLTIIDNCQGNGNP